jgi:hypothetical protein
VNGLDLRERGNVAWHAVRGQVRCCVRTWAARPDAGGFSPQNHPENQLQRNKCKNKERKKAKQVKDYYTEKL